MYFSFVRIRKVLMATIFKNVCRVLRLRRKRFSFKYKIHNQEMIVSISFYFSSIPKLTLHTRGV